MNTRFSYMYRDSANWKTFYDCVVAGEFSDAQKEAIQNACDGTYFIPSVLGLPGGVLQNDPGYDERYDHPWCEFDADCDLSLTEDPPTVSYTADSLTQAFVECQDKWEALPEKESVELPRVAQPKQTDTTHIPTDKAVWSYLDDAKITYDTTHPAYTQAKKLLASICEQQFPELYDAIFQHVDQNLIFSRPDGSFQLVYYNPDSDAGGQIIQCPFDASQAFRMQDNDAYLDILSENTQYLSDIDNEHFFRIIFELLEARREDRFLGTDIHAVCRGITAQQHGIGGEKPSVETRIASAASRAGGTDQTDGSLKHVRHERNNDLHEK